MISPYARRAALSALILACAFSRAGSQDSTRVGRAQSDVVGYLGITAIQCDCTFDTRVSDAWVFRFRSDPVVAGVARRGPSAGILFPGDTIFDIDGVPLQTPTGASSFANVRPGQRITLGLRRAGQAVRIAMTAGSIAADDPSALGQFTPIAPMSSIDNEEYGVFVAPTPPPAPRAPVAPAAPAAPVPPAPPAPGSPRAMMPPRAPPAPRAPAAPETPAAPRAPRAMTPEPWTLPRVPLPPLPPVPPSPASPKGWFGFSIRCSQCGWSLEGGDESPRWESSTPPEVGIVAPGGPAAAADFRTGDLITHIDGQSILQPLGARKLGAVVPGQRIRLTVNRSGAIITRQLTLGERPGARTGRNMLRYTGRLSDVDIQVWSAAGATVKREGDTLTISVGGSTVRLKAATRSR